MHVKYQTLIIKTFGQAKTLFNFNTKCICFLKWPKNYGPSCTYLSQYLLICPGSESIQIWMEDTTNWYMAFVGSISVYVTGSFYSTFLEQFEDDSVESLIDEC